MGLAAGLAWLIRRGLCQNGESTREVEGILSHNYGNTGVGPEMEGYE